MKRWALVLALGQGAYDRLFAYYTPLMKTLDWTISPIDWIPEPR